MVLHADGMKKNCCKICGSNKKITRHHIRPRCFVKKKLRGPSPQSRTIKLCQSCHLNIHETPGRMRLFMRWLQEHRLTLWWEHTHALKWLEINIDKVEKRCGKKLTTPIVIE